jgi:mRNA interferase MazF
LVNFDPSLGHEYRRVRPALIVQSDAYVAAGNLLVVIPLSSKTAKRSKLDLLVPKDAENRLKTDSLLKMKQISSFDKRRFIKLIGVVNAEVLKRAEERVGDFLFQRSVPVSRRR